MPKDITIAISVIAGAGVVVGVAFMFPALGGGGATTMRGISKAKYDEAVVEEKQNCEANGGTNCDCVAQTAGAVKAYESPRALGATYMDQTQLARQQAKDRC